MSTPITVTGGTDGTTARFEDMLGVAALLANAAADVDEALDVVRAAAFICAVGDGFGMSFLDALLVRKMLEDLASPIGFAALVADRLRVDAGRLLWAVTAYHDADTGVVASIGRSLTALPQALGAGTVEVLNGGGLGDTAQVVLGQDPGLVDTVAVLSPFAPVEALLGPRYPDGHAVVHDVGIDTRPASPPRQVADLIDGVAVRSSGAPGEISVSFVTGANGVRRVIVDIPGTKSWSSGQTSDVTSLSTNARALVGAHTAYEQGVLIAMARAGVRPTDDVMLVGHSEGGMVAVTTAREAVGTGRFRITHVVTAGSPIGRTVGSVPGSVRVLALENERDLVPHADGRPNPDRRNVTTVTMRHGDGTVSDDHDLRDSYEPGAHDVDVSTSASVRDFVRSADGFLNASKVETHVFVVSRSYR